MSFIYKYIPYDKWIFQIKAKFNLENLSPQRMLQNAKRMINPFQPRSMVEFAKSILEWTVKKQSA